MASAQRAADLWAAEAADGQSFEAAWKLARACQWLGTNGPEKGRRAALERGVKAGEQAITLEPGKPEGHFWLAANMGRLAESFGLVQGLKYRGRVRDELRRVLAIDPAWQEGSADRALGWWYFRVPRLFGGSRGRAEEHLRKSLTYDPENTLSLLFLADILIADGRKDEGRKLLQQVIDAPIDPDWAPEDRVNKRKAEEKLSARIARSPDAGQYL
jgi:hypothetical protein